MKHLASYISGFVLSVTLTLVAYFSVVDHWLTSASAITFILVLAVVQLIVQMIFFLHLGEGSGMRWNLAAFIGTLAVILILVGGSLWIMYHLNYNMTPDQMNAYIQSQDSL